MKITKNLKKIQAQTSNVDRYLGTTFYKASLDELKKVVEQADISLWIQASIDEYGFDALNLEKLYGSAIIEDDIYLCDTDGYDIIVNGKEVDPEAALEDYPLENLEGYIKSITQEIVEKYFDMNTVIVDFDDLAISLLESGNSFESLVEAYQDLI